MLSNWDRVGRFSLDVASAATSVGFAAAKNGTKLGFAITRGVASAAAGLTGSVLDHAIFGGKMNAGPALGGFVASAISTVESLTLAPIAIGESIASTTLVAAHSSLSVLQAVFPGSDEASFSLASFITLVRREWHDDMQDGTSPEQRYGVTEVAKALVAWATVQGKTAIYQERKWFKHLKEIKLEDKHTSSVPPALDGGATVRFMKDAPRSNQILTADIGEAGHSGPVPSKGSFLSATGPHTPPGELKATLRRFSKLVLAGYGGASLLFFGVPPVPSSSLGAVRKEDEEAQLAMAVNSSEHEAAGGNDRIIAPGTTPQQLQPGTASYSWWDVLLGRHDEDILLHYAEAQTHLKGAPPKPTLDQPAITATFGGNGTLMPRFWVLADHARREVVLVLRGTMSLNELAVDLTCDPADFRLNEPSTVDTAPEDIDEDAVLDAFEEQLDNIPGSFPMDLSTPATGHTLRRTRSLCSTSSEDDGVYQVHGGILKMAKAMGSRGKPVHITVRHALKRNEGYNLVICGHSLGAGVAALLALMWADPWTCMTHRSSGLPSGRRVAVYCFAPPCLASARLSRLAAINNLITSFVYSHDIVSRLSLGSVRDLRRAASWLCEAEKDRRGDGYGGVSARALKAKTGFGKDGDEEWFLSIRKTLEANMHMAHLYPPGRVLWALRDGDLEPAHRLRPQDTRETDKLRLFEVQDVEQVFNQIVFARDMLSSHLPHQYDRALHELR
ncbi:hypothetical protein NM688_g9276 [Phlebia brevispora]|uniref:Uncharacterized protein n=1 Tax=Phlebia brevispora TaxID=194682 RepID=A0ACC1RJB9_9APHY|nr:hypothetical protein NM688_g9276 [Phlebia brevispora]